MRRILSFVLLLAFSLPLILPALALAQGPDANLPACCRRNGAHHCAMTMRGNATPAAGVNLSTVPPRCPCYPALVTPLRHVDLASPMTLAAFAEIVSHSAVRPRSEARAPAALDGDRPKRGPPSLLL